MSKSDLFDLALKFINVLNQKSHLFICFLALDDLQSPLQKLMQLEDRLDSDNECHRKETGELRALSKWLEL